MARVLYGTMYSVGTRRHMPPGFRVLGLGGFFLHQICNAVIGAIKNGVFFCQYFPIPEIAVEFAAVRPISISPGNADLKLEKRMAWTQAAGC
jgi:hypothetical protein